MTVTIIRKTANILELLVKEWIEYNELGPGGPLETEDQQLEDARMMKYLICRSIDLLDNAMARNRALRGEK
jgi:hypothetical protein